MSAKPWAMSRPWKYASHAMLPAMHRATTNDATAHRFGAFDPGPQLRSQRLFERPPARIALRRRRGDERDVAHGRMIVEIQLDVQFRQRDASARPTGIGVQVVDDFRQHGTQLIERHVVDHQPRLAEQREEVQDQAIDEQHDQPNVGRQLARNPRKEQLDRADDEQADDAEAERRQIRRPGNDDGTAGEIHRGQERHVRRQRRHHNAESKRIHAVNLRDRAALGQLPPAAGGCRSFSAECCGSADSDNAARACRVASPSFPALWRIRSTHSTRVA